MLRAKKFPKIPSNLEQLEAVEAVHQAVTGAKTRTKRLIFDSLQGKGGHSERA